MRVVAVLAALTMAAGCGTTLPRDPGSPGGVGQRSVERDRITGQVNYRDLAALPRPGELKIILTEGDDGPIVAEERVDILDTSSPPFPFTLNYDKGMIDRGRDYMLSAEVRDAGGDLRFASRTPVAVLTQDAPSRDVSLSIAAAAPPRPRAAAAPQAPAALAAPRVPPASRAAAAATAPTLAPETPAAEAPVARTRTAATVTAAAPLILPAAPSAGAGLAPAAPAPRVPTPAPARAAAPAPAATTTPAASSAPANPTELRFDRIDFRAIGPNWILDLYPNRMDLSFEDGGRRIEVARPVPIQPPYPGLIYQARLGERTLVVTIRREACRVAATGETYPSRVTVEVEGQTLEGCGRAV